LACKFSFVGQELSLVVSAWYFLTRPTADPRCWNTCCSGQRASVQGATRAPFWFPHCGGAEIRRHPAESGYGTKTTLSGIPRVIDPHRDTWTVALNASSSAFVIGKQKCGALITEAIKNGVPNVRDQAPARTIWKPLMLIHEAYMRATIATIT
jgi:hypothetical protein